MHLNSKLILYILRKPAEFSNSWAFFFHFFICMSVANFNNFFFPSVRSLHFTKIIKEKKKKYHYYFKYFPSVFANSLELSSVQEVNGHTDIRYIITKVSLFIFIPTKD